MPQGFPLDRGRRRSYYLAMGAGLAVLGCQPSTTHIAPQGLRPQPPAVVRDWVHEVRPAAPTRIDLRWRFTNQQGSAAGRAVVRYQGPDTLRFDFRAPFGRSGAALFVGPEMVWAAPADQLADLVPTAPLFWVSVGMPLDPSDGAGVSGLRRGTTRAWRYVEATDTLDVVWQPEAALLTGEFRRAGRTIGTTEVQYDSAGHPATAELRFPGQAARLNFRFEAVATVDAFGPEVWQRP